MKRRFGVSVIIWLVLIAGSTLQARVDTLTIRQIQEVPVGRDSSYYVGDTVQTCGVITSIIELLYLGILFDMEMPEGGPFSGIMVNSSNCPGIPSVVPGDSVCVIAVVNEYGWIGPPSRTMTELDIVPWGFDFRSFGNPEPPPLLITAALLDSTGQADSLGEQCEAVLCRVYDVTVDTAIIYSTNSTWICHDTTGHQFMIREASDSINFVPAVGFRFAYVQGVINHRFGCYCLEPRYMRDLEPWTGLNDNPALPRTMELYQNYPNPFNTRTTVPFTIKEQAPVTISAFNILGQKVATILDQEVLAGSYTITWDAGNLPSGTYFYRICAGPYQMCRKLVLLK